MSVRGRRAALLVVALVVGFQLPGLGRDGLLSDASALSGTALWREGFATVWAETLTSDYVRYFAPWAAFVQGTLRAGTLPLWNPYVGTGVPVSEALQPALFHPFTLFLVALPVEHALTVLALLRLALAGLGAFALARVLGCGGPAATLAGVMYGLEPFHLVLRFHTLPNVSACLPWLLALSEHRLRADTPRWTLPAWALVAALACLGGHSQTTLHVLAVATAYHLARMLAGRATIRRELGFLAAALLLAALGGLVALWGHAELVLDGWARTYRTVRGAYPRLPPSHLPSFVVPGTRGVQVPGYVGLLALVLAAGGLAGRAPFPAWPWAALTLAAGAVAYGLRPIADVIGVLPFVGLADHSRLLIVVHLGVALLAARGVECLGDPRARRAMIVALGLLAATLVWIAGGLPRGRLLIPAASLVFAGALLALPRALPAAGWLAALLVVADLYAAYGPHPRGGVRAFPPTPAALAPLAGHPGGDRVLLANRVLPPNIASFYDVPALAAFEPSMSEATVQLLALAGLNPSFHLGVVAGAEVSLSALRVLDVLGAGLVVLPDRVGQPAARARLQELRHEPLAVYQNPQAMPRVFAVADARVAPDPLAALALVGDARLDLRRTVVLEGTSVEPARGGSPDADAALVSYAPGLVAVRATCADACWVVLTETFAPGWRARVDGAAVSVLRADRALVAVAVPAGTHDVELAYRPASVLIGAPVSVLVLVALAAAALRGARLAPRGMAR
jgi:hypothetical protein